MNFLRKPAIALIVSVVLIITSTFISSHVKLQNKADDVTACFISGYRASGQRIAGIAENLNAFLNYAHDVSDISSAYNLDTVDCDAKIQLLESALEDYRLYGVKAVTKSCSVSEVSALYSDCLVSVRGLIKALMLENLSEDDLNSLNKISAGVDNLDVSITENEYNKKVFYFNRKYCRSLAEFFMRFTGVCKPTEF